MAPLALTGLVATYRFHCIDFRNAYPGNGGEHILGNGGENEDEAPSVLNSEGCQAYCSIDPECECVVFMAGQGRCWKRRACDPEHFVHDTAFSVCMQEEEHDDSSAVNATIEADETSTTTTASSSDVANVACGHRANHETVNCSMVVESVDYTQLAGNPALMRSFKKAIQHAVAVKAGRYVHDECVDVRLSPGSVGVLALINPPNGGTFIVANCLSNSVGELRRLVTHSLATVVNNSGVDTGRLTVSDIHIHAPSWVGTPAMFPEWWMLLLALLFLLSMTVMLAQASMIRRIKLSSRDLLPLEDPEQSTSAGLKVVFLDATKTQHHMVFNCAPWGLVFHKDDPTKVQDFRVGSYAKVKGVKQGWRLTQVGEKYVPPVTKSQDLERLIDEACRNFQAWPLRLDFNEKGGKLRTIYFKEGPLGMEFYNALPIVIDEFKANSVAKEMGVQLGWVLVRVGEVDLHSFTNFDDAVERICDGVSQLPAKSFPSEAKSDAFFTSEVKSNGGSENPNAFGSEARGKFVQRGKTKSDV